MDEPTYPALSLRQPWADLIVNGIKNIENRSRPTRFRGRLLIHASKKVEWERVEKYYKLLGLVSPENYQPVVDALLFQEAARRQELTVEKALEVAAYLRQARTEPSLRFVWKR
jgi:hypothetical protein